MTTLVILLLGLGSALITSAFETNPDGSDVSLLQTISDIWNDNLNFKQGSTSTSSSTSASTASAAAQAAGIRSAEQNQQYAMGQGNA